MAICSFLGTYVYEDGIFEELKKAANEVAQGNQDVDFWLYHIRHGKVLGFDEDFFNICFTAVWEIKQRYPEKNITLSIVVKNEDADEYLSWLNQWDTNTPLCTIDRVIAAPAFPAPKNEKDVSAIVKKIERWVIEQSTHVISYLYPELFEVEKQYLDLVKRRGKIILDITRAETSAFIIESIGDLDERGQKIMEGLIGGQTQKQIADQLGVSSSAVQQGVKNAYRALKEKLAKRLTGQKKLSGNILPPLKSCSVFALSDVTYNTLSAFEQAAAYLIKKHHVTQFHILCEYCQTGYMSVLRSLSKKYKEIQLVAITHYPDINSMTREEWHDAASPYCPPCHAVENIDTYTDEPQEQVLRAVNGLIKQSDFCICNLSDSPLAEKIREYILNAKEIKVLDISKQYAGAD